MAENYKIFPLRASAGIKRDGTQTEGNYWNDGQWTRFYRGLPRSMLGYRSMTEQYPQEPSRGLFVSLNDIGLLNVFSGSANYLSVGQFTTSGFGSGVTDITPSGFAGNSANIWQLDSFYNQNGGGQTSIIAHAAPNLSSISSDIGGNIYYGNINGSIALTAALTDGGGSFTISGGILALDPYVIAYGSLGLVQWSALNDPTTFPVANAANVTPTKIVKALSVRGSGAPACLLWSLDSIILMTFVGGAAIWNFATISDQSSILSSSCPVEMDGIYYWIGVDRFYVYNGTLRELPNEMNLDYFFSNLNFNQRQKVFGFKLPHWGEIWWCYPSGTSAECNHAIIYNVRENTWYDTALPSDGRSAAYFAQSWQYPVMAGANPYDLDNAYQLWQSEFGYDEIEDNNINAINSYVTSPPISIVSGGLTVLGAIAAQSRWTQLKGFEPDFIFGSQLNINILTRKFAQDTDTVSYNIITQGVNYFDTQVQGRYVRFQISSNVEGGYFVMGTPNILYREGQQVP